jgi:hypothetical protein
LSSQYRNARQHPVIGAAAFNNPGLPFHEFGGTGFGSSLTIERHLPRRCRGVPIALHDRPATRRVARVEQPDAGVAKITAPLANPTNYFEVTFNAQANTPYRLWFRGRAQADSYANDSFYVQFSGSVTSTGTPVNRIQTTEAVPMVLEDCGGCGVAGWGWQDDGYGTGVLGPLMYFTAGPQIMRIQGREDGIEIDQFVLSPDIYLTSAPGATKNDTTILTKTP